ncbi:STT3 domain-containing protein [Nitratiruptor sp. YY09-18]|uniref:STT3 domain-containing protein n=1 Tax=Nitratiruptor sp. YY09-18 TaxID=2724901 RepID=UPI0019169914|nr:STT3 domain-containing protein [Nitratiruptor sp. YY09-18]BCD68033.1 undecaprenyl-diphosphooligosaccharide---protein glycotransferase [Nitratiruptor sp. YY09-18]
MNKKWLSYILLAYCISFLFRLFLAFLAKHHPEFLYNGHIIALWTADAGLYASYAKKLLAGSHLPLTSDTFMGYVLYWIAKYLHLPLDIVIFYIPAFFASLIVVPLFLLFAFFKLEKLGFWSAVISSIAMNYYFRTHLGYTDTDILNFFFFFMILASFVGVVQTKNSFWSIPGALSILLFLFWYHSAKPLIFALLGFYAFYLLIFSRKDKSAYIAFFIYIAAIIPLPVWLRVALIFILPPLFSYLFTKKEISYKPFFILFLLAALGAGYMAIKYKVYKRGLDYLQKKEEYVLKEKSGRKVELEATLKTIAESSKITPQQLFTYSSGSSVIFGIGSLGLLLLILRYRPLLFLLLPYLLAIVSLKAGVRFTTFGVPVIVMGYLYLFYFLWQRWKEKRFSKLIYYAPATFLFIYYLTIMNQYNHMLSPFFKRGELHAIDQHLNNNERGYILTWWDYGWPLWYYTNKRTLIDNGKHHYDNFIVAKTLFSSDQNFIANMNRYFIEQYDKIYPWAILPYTIHRIPLEELLEKLQNNQMTLPPKKNEIYYYFDDRILTKLPVIKEFSHLKGESTDGFVWVTNFRVYYPSKKVIIGDNLKIDLENGYIYVPGGKDRFGTLYISDGEKITNTFQYRDDDFSIIVYKNRYIIGTYKYINSFFFRAFFFNDLDKSLFKTLNFDKNAKIFQLIGR